MYNIWNFGISLWPKSFQIIAAICSYITMGFTKSKLETTISFICIQPALVVLATFWGITYRNYSIHPTTHSLWSVFQHMNYYLIDFYSYDCTNEIGRTFTKCYLVYRSWIYVDRERTKNSFIYKVWHELFYFLFRTQRMFQPTNSKNNATGLGNGERFM